MRSPRTLRVGPWAPVSDGVVRGSFLLFPFSRSRSNLAAFSTSWHRQCRKASAGILVWERAPWFQVWWCGCDGGLYRSFATPPCMPSHVPQDDGWFLPSRSDTAHRRRHHTRLRPATCPPTVGWGGVGSSFSPPFDRYLLFELSMDTRPRYRWIPPGISMGQADVPVPLSPVDPVRPGPPQGSFFSPDPAPPLSFSQRLTSM